MGSLLHNLTGLRVDPHFCFIAVCIHHGHFHQQTIVFFVNFYVLDVSLMGGRHCFNSRNYLISRHPTVISSHHGRCTNCQGQCCCERNKTTNRHVHTPVGQKENPNTPIQNS